MNRACFYQNTTKCNQSHEQSGLKLHEQKQHASCIRPIKNKIVRMKKLYLIWIFFNFLATHLTFANETSYSQKYLEDRYWEFIKERLFDGKTPFLPKFQKDIIVVLQKATRQDSLIVKNLCEELNDVLTDRKILIGPLAAYNRFSIFLNFGGNMADNSKQFMYVSADVNGNQIFQSGGSKSFYDLSLRYINLRFNDTVSFAERKQYIEYVIVRSLCHLQGDPQHAKVWIKGAILNDFSFNPQGTHYTDVDKFVLAKLYSRDFREQFKNYMLKKYSWLYYMNFIDADGMKFRSYLISVIFGLIILIFTYNKVINRKYKRIYLSYLFPGLLIANSLILILAVAAVFQNYHVYYSQLWWPMLLLNVFAILVSSMLFFVEHFFLKPSMMFSVRLVMKVSLLLLMLLIPVFFLFDKDWSYLTALPLCFALALGRGAHLYFREINQSIINKKDLEMSRLKELKAQAEINSINARINPHFLYNSLNSIAGLIKREPSKAEKMALSLSDMFRYSINRNNDQFLTNKEEVEVVRTYLEIEQIRFGNRLKYDIDADSNCDALKIPRFLIQPLVENAIKHGVSKIEETGIVQLEINQMNDKLNIKVSDNGPAFPEGLVGGYGIQGIYDLLNLIYGDKAELSWQNEPEKSISIRIDLTKLIEKL